MKKYKMINAPIWLENQMSITMQKIENNPEDKDLLSKLDKYISMKKKYDASLDPLGETIRVMEEFAYYTKKNFPQYTSIIREIVHPFMKSKENRRNL
ncbi:MAG: hypothetical protein ACRC0X_02350 [Brevinema sp.]